MSHAWMPLYVADYLADTGHLSTVEHGAYMLLIMHYWQTGGLPEDDRKLARIARLPLDQWQEVRDTLADLFGAGWEHKRIDAELAHASDVISKRSAAAKAMHAKRNAPAQREQCTTNANASAHAEQVNVQTGLQSPSPSPTSDADASGADAPPAAPTYTDARHALYGEGKPILLSLGVAEKQCGAMITRWLRDTGDDCAGILDAIRRARDERVMDPIPWITRALPTRPCHDRSDRLHANRRPTGASQFNAALADAVARRTVGRDTPGDPGSDGTERARTGSRDGELFAADGPSRCG